LGRAVSDSPASSGPPRALRVEGDHAWARLLETLPTAHLLQSASWGEFKSHYGWRPERWAWKDSSGRALAAAQVLRRWWPADRRWTSILYCPRGPAMDWADRPLARAVLLDLAGEAAGSRTVMIKIEPDAVASDESEGLLREAGWSRSDQSVQFNSTMLLDVQRDDDELLAAMKAKTRYNIRLAEKRGVVVRPGTGVADFDRLYALYAETSVRNGFVIRPRDYYIRAWGGFIGSGLAQPFLAEIAGEAVAGLIAYRFGRRAWYLYGMSSSAHREAMPNHALQWAAIRWARRRLHHLRFLGRSGGTRPGRPVVGGLSLQGRLWRPPRPPGRFVGLFGAARRLPPVHRSLAAPVGMDPEATAGSNAPPAGPGGVRGSRARGHEE
jgi:lipid II:glycine glycyltransferase (peptidoglycan interpeptide bridge formation enzyme)